MAESARTIALNKEKSRVGAGVLTSTTQSYIQEMDIKRQSGQDDVLLLVWKAYKKSGGKQVALTHIDHFDVDWEYYDAVNNRWLQGNNGTKQVPPSSAAGGFYQDTFTVPSPATTTKVRARVRALSGTTQLKIRYETTSSKNTSSTSNGKTKNTQTSTSSVKEETVTVAWWHVPVSGWTAFNFNAKIQPEIPAAPDVETMVGADPKWNSNHLKGVKVSWGSFEPPTTCMVIWRLEDSVSPSDAVKLAPLGKHQPEEVFQNPDGATYVDTSVNDGHVYRYIMRAHNRRGGDASDDSANSLAFNKMTNSQFLAALSEPVQSRPMRVADLEASTRSVDDDGSSVLLTWTDQGYAGESYVVRYAKTKSGATTDGEYETYIPDLKFWGDGYERSCVVSGLDGAESYWFNVYPVNSQFDAKWGTPVVRCFTGAPPEAPTPYATDPSYVVGDEVTLFWEHNPVDGSPQQKAKVKVLLDGAEFLSKTISGADNAYVLKLDASKVPDGSVMTWTVSTKGAHKEYSPESQAMSFTVYQKPTCRVRAFESSASGAAIQDGGTLSALPLVCLLDAGSASGQTPVEWSFCIEAAEDFEYVGEDGGYYRMRAGTAMSQAIVTATDPTFATSGQVIEVRAVDGVFTNGAAYNVRASVLMDTGLRSDDVLLPFTCDFSYDLPDPTATAFFSELDYTMRIMAGCYEETEDGEEAGLVPGVKLSVYRIGPDGSPILVADGMDNTGAPVLDAHPSFGTCRYRIVAVDPETDQHAVFDTIDYPVPVYGILVQWNEERIAQADDGELAYRADQVLLPYDVSVEESSDPDRELVEVIGRESPLAFFGTQVRTSGTWSGNLRRWADSDEIAALRRLQGHRGTCYVRETGGAGYGAVATVKFGRSPDSEKVPVTLDLTKVEYDETRAG